jgi:fibro-slime domain-containing protein
MRRLAGAVGVLLVAQCSASGGDGRNHTTPGDSGAGTSGSGGTTGSGGAISIDTDSGVPDAGQPVDTTGCGDGVVQRSKGEICDDGNSSTGDGCSANCQTTEQNFACPVPGERCVSTVVCGDGRVTGTETCDDTNTAPLDGCNRVCRIEHGWTCPRPGERCQAARCGDGVVAGLEECEDDDATPASGDGCSATCRLESGWVCATASQPCRRAVCGDAIVEGGEPCDDGNDIVGDGCSPYCEAEPTCERPVDANGCSSKCGDGLLLAGDSEQCDDGNGRNGDGCSSTCRIEPGHECRRATGTLPNTITVPFVYRDFIALPSATTSKQRHPDFQSRCINQQNDGIVNATLDAQGKPVNSNICNLAANCTLALGPVDQTLDHCAANETCPAFDGCDQLHAQHPLASHPAQDPFHFWYRDAADVNKTKVVAVDLTLTNGAYRFASTNLFPFDGDGWVAAGDEVTWGGHNYGFTTEVRRWFEFGGGELLTFNGDDDVWVFINGGLALDIGGLHGTETRTIRLNTDGSVHCKLGEPGVFDDLVDCRTPSRTLGLVIGNVYEIALLHAERHTFASNFRLALTGFVSEKSVCREVCGNGVQTPSESCDDGPANADGAYGGCTTQCRRGPHCGDGTVQSPQEACDDGTNLTTYATSAQPGCAPGCQLGAFCGDSRIDSLFGEECDDGTNAGGYEGCDPDCTLGPRCGDRILQTPQEGCDDGNQVSGDGCSANCMPETPA